MINSADYYVLLRKKQTRIMGVNHSTPQYFISDAHTPAADAAMINSSQNACECVFAYEEICDAAFFQYYEYFHSWIPKLLIAKNNLFYFLNLVSDIHI